MADPSNQSGRSRERLLAISSNGNEIVDSIIVDPSQKSCQLCDEYDNEDMVRCDNEQCKHWYHFLCARVSREEVESVTWVCNHCRVETSKHQAQIDAENKSTKSSRSSKKTQKSRVSSAGKRHQLALEKIEEERRLREIREKEYLESKYKAMEQMIQSESDGDFETRDEEDLAEQAMQYTSDWVEKVDLTNDTLLENNHVAVLYSQVPPTVKSVGVSSVQHRQTSSSPSFWREYQYNVTGIQNRLAEQRLGQNRVTSSGNAIQTGQDGDGRNRRDTTYSVFTNQAPINSSVEKSTNQSRYPKNQVRFNTLNQYETTTVVHQPTTTSVENASTHRQVLNPPLSNEQGVLISVNGGVPTTAVVLQRPSVQGAFNKKVVSSRATGHSSNADLHLGRVGKQDWWTDRNLSDDEYMDPPNSKGFANERGQQVNQKVDENLHQENSKERDNSKSKVVGGQQHPKPSFIGESSTSAHVREQVYPNRNSIGGRMYQNEVFSGQIPRVVSRQINLPVSGDQGRYSSNREEHDNSSDDVEFSSNANANLQSSGFGQTFVNRSNRTDNGNRTMNGSVARLEVDQIAARHAMPKTLPKFTGRPKDWPIFISTYENSTSTCGYSNNENLGRLRDCLDGDAKDAVFSMLLHPDSVPAIIETLKMLFGRPELVAESLMDELHHESTPKENDLNALVKFAIKVRNLVETLRKFGPLDYLQNPMLLNKLVERLPTQTRINWAYYKSTNPRANLASFGDWLYSLAQVTSQVIGRTKSESSAKESKDKAKMQNSKSNHVNAQLDNSPKNRKADVYRQVESSGSSQPSESNASTKRKCPICSLESCKQIQECSKMRSLTPAERWNEIKGRRLCFSCFGKHRHFKCKSRKKCQVNGCQSTHHVLLHDNDRLATSQQNYNSSSTRVVVTNADSSTGSGLVRSNCNSLRTKKMPAIFRIVPVTLYGKKKAIQTFAYLDDGSDLSLLDRDLVNELELKGTPDILNVHWAFKNSEEQSESETVSVRISGNFKSAQSYKIENVYIVEKLFLPTQSITRDWLESYGHLRNLPITTYEDAAPRILIGLHSSRLMVSRETVEGELSEPIACRTRLGWIVQGPDQNDDTEVYENNEIATPVRHVSLNMCEGSADNQLHQLVKEFFSFESFGVRIPEKLLESKEITRAKEIMDSTTVKKDGKYETYLLWRYDNVYLPDSYGMALKRLNSLENKMLKDPVLGEKLCGQMKDFIEKKYIHKLLPHEIEHTSSQRIWYLPIFVVFNPKKPQKFRTVWDAAAKVKNVSLNSVLLKGPDQLVPLPDVLRRFRERLFAVTGDIGEMYHRVGVIEQDRNVQRFLWREGKSDRKPDVYSMDVLTFGSACSPSSAQFVKNKNALEHKDQFPRAVEAIVENTYIDDMLDCTHTIEEAISLLNDVKHVHKQASFEFGKFTSNSVEVLQALGMESNQQVKNLNISSDVTTERVLGMFWNTKILLQRIWRKSTKWDEQIPESLEEDWLAWIRFLPKVEQLEIPRLYSTKLSPNCPSSIQMHTFVDAGNEACAALTYFRFEDEYGVDCSLVSAKTRVAPNKPLTVPRLELQAAVLGSRLAISISQSQRFTINKRFFWSDSQTVISWIMSETRKYNQFVAFRIGEILDNSAECEWNWIGTDDNVADEATKSSNKPEISSLSRWFKGPSFLYQPESEWNNNIEKNQFTTDEELRPKYLLAQFVNKCEEVIDPNRFSDWRRLRRVMAFTLRFIDNLRLGKKNRLTGPLSRVEYVRAENQLYRQAQKDKFADEIAIIEHNSTVAVDKRKNFDKSSLLKNCSPYIDNVGVLRMKSRMDAAQHLTFRTKRPIILPRDHRITKLIVLDHHRKLHHLNHQTTLNELYQSCFVPALRRVLKSTIHNMCQRCKNDRANPQVPEMADLPPSRVASFTRPFSHAGIDYFGPYWVKVNTTKRKRWGVLITCLTTRAVHIEVAESLSTSECILAIRRFNARRGAPIAYYSDNGSNFHGSEKELRKEFQKLNFAVIEETFTDSLSQWTFNPPLAPHMGGSWERMIRTVKSILKKSMPTRIPTQKMFETYLVEAEYIINSRPLTYVHLDHNEDEVLTPNHFLLGSSGGVRSPGIFDETHLLRDDWKAVQHMTDLFWRRFNVEYLPTLTRRTKWFKDVKPIEVGDVVIVVDDKNERNTWPKGIVEEVYPGKGNRVRQALVRLVRGRDKLSKIGVTKIKYQTLVRPVAKLAVLDVKSELNPSDEAVYGRENVKSPAQSLQWLIIAVKMKKSLV